MTNIDHGIPVNAEEARTGAICFNQQGEERLVIAARGFVMIINPETEKATQLFFPEKYMEYPFASYSSDAGLFYTGAGKMLMILDPFQEKFIDYQWIENGEEIFGFSFAEDSHGQIYFTSYPSCHLLQYYPNTKAHLDHGSMDDTQKYPGSIAVDHYGWIYMGVGTERKNIIAYHPETKEKKSFIADQERTRGAGYVYKGIDGSVYGHWEAKDLKDVLDAKQWKIFLNGKFQRVKFSNISPSLYSGTGFNKIHRNGQGKHFVTEHSLSEGFIVINNEKRIDFTYQSAGAQLSILFLGPDQHLYGTSLHPLQLFRYDFELDKIHTYGAIEKGGGGNIAAYAAQGPIMIGFAYAGGKIYEFDFENPLGHRNPKLISEHEEIHRPRCAISHPDGKHIIWGGFPGYGMAGGGLGIYDVRTKNNIIIPHTSIVPAQSTLCLGVLSSGDIFGGTSIETPGGASSTENDAVLYLFDWTKKEVVYTIKPVQGSREISQLFIDKKDRAHCLTIEGMYFVFDPYEKKIIYSADLSMYGIPVRNGFALNEAEADLYFLLSHAIMKVKIDEIMAPDMVVRIEEAATSGIAYKNGRLYYGCGSRLMSIEVEGG